MDDMAAEDLALSTMRVRQSTVSSFCVWLVKREVLAANPVAKLERPPHHREPGGLTGIEIPKFVMVRQGLWCANQVSGASRTYVVSDANRG